MNQEASTREAACSCGQLRASVRGEPLRVAMCHCLACQRRTGSTYGVNARFPEEAVRLEGRHTEYARVAESGNVLRFSFCPDCGTTVLYRNGALPGMVGLPVGGFADPEFAPTQLSIYEESRHPWVSVPEGAERDPG